MLLIRMFFTYLKFLSKNKLFFMFLYRFFKLYLYIFVLKGKAAQQEMYNWDIPDLI